MVSTGTPSQSAIEGSDLQLNPGQSEPDRFLGHSSFGELRHDLRQIHSAYSRARNRPLYDLRSRLAWFLDQDAFERAFALMERYADHPMDLADASLVAAAEALETRKIFTIDRNDFSTYRLRRGQRNEAFEIVG